MSLIHIKIGDADVWYTPEEARVIYEQLGELFNPPNTNAPADSGTVGDWVAMNPPTATPRGQHEWTQDEIQERKAKAVC